MKVGTCQFSGLKIHPGRGTTYVRGDSKSFVFVSRKTRRAFLARRNPRKIRWTAIYRRLNKKGIVEDSSRRRSKRNTKVQRAVGSMTLEEIMAKKSQSASVRSAARDAAIRAAKEKKGSKKAGGAGAGPKVREPKRR